MAIKVVPHRCPQNHPCPAVRMCPRGALVQRGYRAPQVDPSRCTGCGLCVRFCGFGAIQPA
ncbi:4Fe-4S ferredoxin iron-sulfur binding domain-containing protein [Spirochaeta thermophila DSM 6578]|uniref:4Fe-4S ferredoxin iron-sulfur binding domain-containing protein n=1 Tax=Winmispira thermophila (strain ATCC 700085 / DSM 6578 / Z-1203) TaxID=869211 RepID=G0GDX7_WINT7|nr:4Fe-4S binding protein [Spirochaeta thermophila]AEJ60609.1 4Fe-4S ferredoxin iron-sulfur binding domain-containing protein [Spirochaeta thermophila DSM 6578]